MKLKSLLLGLALVAAIAMTAFAAAESPNNSATPDTGNGNRNVPVTLTANADIPLFNAKNVNTDIDDGDVIGNAMVYEQVKKDGTIVYSIDGGNSWIIQKDYETLYPAHDIEWWTYEEYAQFVEQQKILLQKMADENVKGYTSTRGDFTWTQVLVDEAIARYEQDLENIKNGTKISKSIGGLESGTDGGAAVYESYSLDPKEPAAHTVEITLSDGTIKQFSGEDKADVYEQVKNFCTKQVASGKITQEETNAILESLK